MRDTVKRVKRYTTDRKKTYTNLISEKGLVLRYIYIYIYSLKNLQKINDNNIVNLVKQIAKSLEQAFHQKGYR